MGLSLHGCSRKTGWKSRPGGSATVTHVSREVLLRPEAKGTASERKTRNNPTRQNSQHLDGGHSRAYLLQAKAMATSYGAVSLL